MAERRWLLTLLIGHRRRMPRERHHSNVASSRDDAGAMWSAAWMRCPARNP